MDEWLSGARDAIAEAAGIDAASLELDDESVRTLLDLARIAAHESGERTNAPLAQEGPRGDQLADLHRAVTYPRRMAVSRAD